MTKTLDMQLMRYMNLFERVSKVQPMYCFLYNSGIIFISSEELVSMAIGENGKNVKKINEILGKKIKVIACPRDIRDVEKFVTSVVHPITFKKIDITENEIIINAGRQSKAMLIGRNKVRFHELQEILKEYFNRNLRIV